MKIETVRDLLPEISEFKKDGSRYLGTCDSFSVEVIPSESISFLSSNIERSIYTVFNHYLSDPEMVLDVLKSLTENAVAEPNQKFTEDLGDFVIALQLIQTSDSREFHSSLSRQLD